MGKKMYLKDAAKELGIASHYLRQMAKAGKIPCLKAGNRYVFSIEQCEEFLEKKALENIKSKDVENAYGKLRKVNAD